MAMMAPMTALVHFVPWLDASDDSIAVRIGGKLFKYHVSMTITNPDIVHVDVGLSGAVILTQHPFMVDIESLPVKVSEFSSGPFPIEPLTCVTITKRILGISNWRIQTPMQLKRYIESFPCIEGVYQIG